MKSFTFLLFFTMPITSIANDNNFLIGEWVSDKDKTLSYNKSVSVYSSTQIELLTKLLGKLTYTFTKNQFSWSYEDIHEKINYTIINQTPEKIEISISDNENTIFYKEDKWLYHKTNKTSVLNREYFKPLKKTHNK